MDFEKIINSSKNIVPKRLSFDFLNPSPTSQNRKYSILEQFVLLIITSNRVKKAEIRGRRSEFEHIKK